MYLEESKFQKMRSCVIQHVRFTEAYANKINAISLSPDSNNSFLSVNFSLDSFVNPAKNAI